MKSINNNYKVIPLHDIVVMPPETKLKNPEMLQHLTQSIVQNGQSVPAHVRVNEQGEYELISGRFILQALSNLEITAAMCYDLGRISSAEAKLAALKVNMIQFPWDDVGLSTLIHDLTSHYTMEELYKSIPLSKKKVDALIELRVYDWEKETVEQYKKRQERAEKKRVKFLNEKMKKERKKGVHLYDRIGLDLFKL